MESPLNGLEWNHLRVESKEDAGAGSPAPASADPWPAPYPARTDARLRLGQSRRG